MYNAMFLNLYRDDIMIYSVIIMFQGQSQGYLRNNSFYIPRKSVVILFISSNSVKLLYSSPDYRLLTMHGIKAKGSMCLFHQYLNIKF